jgi:hypothetical protein
MKNLIKYSLFLALSIGYAQNMLPAPIDDAAMKTINVLFLKNVSNFPVVVQQTESTRYPDGSFRPKRTVKTFFPGQGNPLVDFRGYHLDNTPFPLLSGSSFEFYPDKIDEKRFPIPLESEQAALVITVFSKGWQSNGDGVFTFVLTTTGNKIKVTEIEKKPATGQWVKSFYSSFTKDPQDFIYFDAATLIPLRPGEDIKEKDTSKIPSNMGVGVEVYSEKIEDQGITKEVPLLRMYIKPRTQFKRT